MQKFRPLALHSAVDRLCTFDRVLLDTAVINLSKTMESESCSLVRWTLLQPLLYWISWHWIASCLALSTFCMNFDIATIVWHSGQFYIFPIALSILQFSNCVATCTFMFSEFCLHFHFLPCVNGGIGLG